MKNENKKIDLEEAKSLQLGILDSIDNFCLSNNILYYLSFGTLLGAVRHEGYIPWDDDIDITMPYPDYVKFCKEFSSDNYRVHVWFLDKDFFCNFAKVEDVRTIQIEQVDSKHQIGINIDLSPMIGLPEDLSEAKKHFERIVFYRKILNLKQLKLRKGRSILKSLIIIGSKILLFPVSYYLINKKINKLASKYDFYSSKYCICVGSFNPSKEIIERSVIGKTIRLKFEDRYYNAPAGYDAWLKQMFGDYMKLPPIEEQITHHIFETYWKD